MLVHPGGRWHGAFEHSEASELTLNSHSHYVTHGCHVRQPDAKLGHLLTLLHNQQHIASLSEGTCSPEPGEQSPSLNKAVVRLLSHVASNGPNLASGVSSLALLSRAR